MDLGLAGRGFLITGGTDGLGLALAARLVEEGARVAVCGRDPERVRRAQERLGAGALCVVADVTESEALASFVEGARREFGHLDGAVSNAGRSSGALIASSTDEMWRDDFELKVLAAVRLARLTSPLLVETGGCFLSVLSIMAKTPGPGSTPTAASRAAGLALTKALAAELAPGGARANALLIGLIESGQWVRAAERAGVELPDFYQQVAARQSIPLGRFGRAEEFADVAAFLLSPRASYLTGCGINVDGGLSPVT